MNDVDPQFRAGDPADKMTLRPREQVPQEPTPVCTLFSDGGIRVENGVGLTLIELQRLMLASVLSISDRTVQRGAAMERVLAGIQQRFDGFDPETEDAIATVLGQRHQQYQQPQDHGAVVTG
jgi:hypothetical protein